MRIPRFVLDTSALINGWNFHYPNAVFPSLWRALGDAMISGHCVAPSEVLVELSKRSDDDLHAWAREREGAFLPPFETIGDCLARIRDYAPHWFRGTGKHEADPFVVALAMDLGVPVVTYEGRAFNGNVADVKGTKRGMLTVCAAVDVDVVLLGDVMRELGVTI